MSITVNEILLKIKEKKDYLSNLQENIKKEIEDLNIQLYNNCNHEWIIDRSNYGEHTEYICKNCLLYKF